MRRTIIAPGEYYHVYNKRILEEPLFREKRDFIRFLFLLVFFQSPHGITNTKRQVDYYQNHNEFSVDKEIKDQIVQERVVELIAFTLMPTHFHILLRELQEGGISRYLQRIEAGYARYYHIKYEVLGHVFKGSFGITYVESNQQLIYLSTYLHRNPRELLAWRNKEQNYPWSSYQDYLGSNRWGKLLKPGIVLGQFNSPAEYRRFVQKSVAKERRA